MTMESIFELINKVLLILHISAGFISIILFWIPVFTRKGGKSHRKVGLLYVYSMSVVVVSAALLSLHNFWIGQIDSAIFLGFLSLLTGNPLWYGYAILNHKKGLSNRYKQIHFIFSVAIMLFSSGMLVYALLNLKEGAATLMIIFAIIGLSGLPQLIQEFNSQLAGKSWYKEHYQGMVISGAAAYTAFFAFGGSRFLSNLFTGYYMIIPWVMPTVVAVVGLRYLRKYYEAKGTLQKTVIKSPKAVGGSIVQISLLFLLAFAPELVNGQDFEKRYSFAKTYVGLDLYAVPAYGSTPYEMENGQVGTFERSGFLSPAINIGATHFWGHADFYVSINTANLKFKQDLLENQTHFGVFTGLRVYPWKSQAGNLRPFVGYKFSPIFYSQEAQTGLSGDKTLVRSVVDLGLTYQSSKFYIYLAYNGVPNPNLDFPISRQEVRSIRLPRSFFNLGINYLIETSALTNNPVNKHFHEVFKGSNQKGWYMGLGPSSAFPLGNSDYVSDLYPFLDQKSMSTVFPDLTLGYHFTRSNMSIGLAGRRYVQQRSAYGFLQQITRRSLGLEAFRLMGDYHGFVPFVGVGLGYESLDLFERDNRESLTNVTQDKLSPYVIFGWDIRPGRKGDWWILRTNLRYAPFLTLDHRGKSLSLQHLEFNFIQFVMYPQRLKAYRNY